MRSEIEAGRLFDKEDLEKFKRIRFAEIYGLTVGKVPTHADLFAVLERPAKSFNERLRVAHNNFRRWEMFYEQALAELEFQ